jgi:Protein of unknown function (DUF3443)/Abnormal spindle-like microcephaly-assoc'd, ASPM-SPD-2-Hydin
MKRLFIRSAFLIAIGTLTIATAALAQLDSDSGAAKAKDPSPHLTVATSIGFGTVKAIESKSVELKNTGTADADVTVTGPAQPSPFTVTAGAGSYSLPPGQEQVISVQFAPTAKESIQQQVTVECPTCSPASNDHLTIKISGSAKGPVPTPTATGPTPTSTTTPTPTATPSPAPGANANALPFSVTAGPLEDTNMPLATITVCATGTSHCAIVNDVLIDTGSFGLRVFGSQLAGLGIAPNANGGSEIGECAFFGSGSTWGSVSTVDVQMAGEPTITIPIQVMDDINAFAPAPRDCTQGSQLQSSPEETGFNGLLGVGGSSNDVIFTDYFNCSGENCSLLNNGPPNADVVPNPVSSLPNDNNGVVVSLPAVAADGQQTVNGTLYFGIGTQSNNQPGSVGIYRENSNVDSEDYLDINTVYKGTTAGGFFDTGSALYFFNDSSIAECSKNSDLAGLYCPADTLSKSATNEGVSGSASKVVTFSVSNAETLLNSNSAAFDNLGATFDGKSKYDGFDWGLPFFFGRTVYLGIDGSSSPLGSGPYTAY